MADSYAQYYELCQCPPGSKGSDEGYFDYMRDICVCESGRVLLGMRDLEEQETTSYPVNVYNINEIFIGTANNKNQYVVVWNSDTDNQAVGTLSAGYGPFGFEIELKKDQISPPWVIGDPNSEVDEGIYGQQYGSEYE